MVKILTWNIYWMAMTNSTDNKSLLGNVCKNNKCKKNITNFIIEKCKLNYKFITLQESSNYEYILKQMEKNNINNYSYFQSADIDSIITFYPKRYELINSYKNVIIRHRPYHILLLKSNKYFYIIINLHNGHGITKELLISRISEGLNSILNINIPITKNNIKILMMGDFNDNNRYDYWKGLLLFKYYKGPYLFLNNIIIKSIKPINSCCSGVYKLRNTIYDDKMYGDYVLTYGINIKKYYVSKTFEPNANIYPTSDHLPITISID